MRKEILALQSIVPVEDINDEVEGERFSTVSGGGCGNWSVLSIAGC